jgi:hypothetical protein
MPEPGSSTRQPFVSSEVETRPSTSLGTNGEVSSFNRSPNPARGEAGVRVDGVMLTVRPSFAALVAAEEELGPLFALVERAAAGELRLAEMAALFWHCLAERPEGLTRERLGEAVVAEGLAAAAPVMRVLVGQILRGR